MPRPGEAVAAKSCCCGRRLRRPKAMAHCAQLLERRMGPNEPLHAALPVLSGGLSLGRLLEHSDGSDGDRQSRRRPVRRSAKKSTESSANGSAHDRTRIVITKVGDGFSESPRHEGSNSILPVPGATAGNRQTWCPAAPTPPEFGWANSSNHRQAGTAVSLSPSGCQRFESQEATAQNSPRLRFRCRSRAHRIAWEHPAFNLSRSHRDTGALD